MKRIQETFSVDRCDMEPISGFYKPYGCESISVLYIEDPENAQPHTLEESGVPVSSIWALELSDEENGKR